MKTILQQATDRGTTDGKAKASWAFDGNTTEATYKRFLQGFEDGDPEIMDAYDVSPLSGEWSGESITELLGDLIEEDEDSEEDILDAYETAFQDAYWNELQRVANLQVA